jgi:[phosphatase 2A protein]-leucine-carboxy methyltransferase
MNRTLSSAVSPPAADGTTSKPVVSQGGSRLDTHLYTLLPLDLRIPDNEPVDSIPGEEGHPLGDKLSNLLDRDVPTLFLAECVYCYMQPEESERIMKWFAEHFGTRGGCVGILFEMCGLE